MLHRLLSSYLLFRKTYNLKKTRIYTGQAVLPKTYLQSSSECSILQIEQGKSGLDC